MVPVPESIAALVHECGGVQYCHPIMPGLFFLLGAQVPNIVRLVSSLARTIRRFFPY